MVKKAERSAAPSPPNGKPPSGLHFWSPLMQAGVMRSLRRSQGGMTVLAAAALAVALLTYAPTDASLNTANGGHTLNALGVVGAVLADTLIQSFGLAAAVPVFVGLAWGVRLMLVGPLSWVWLRVLATVLSCMLLALALAPMAPWVSWPLPGGIAGASGSLLLRHSLRGLASLGLSPTAGWAIAGASGLLSLTLLWWIADLRLGQVGSGLGRLTVPRGMAEWLKRPSRTLNPADHPSREPQFTREPLAPLAAASLTPHPLAAAPLANHPLATSGLASGPLGGGSEALAATPLAFSATTVMATKVAEARVSPRRDLPLRQTSLLDEPSDAITLPSLDLLSAPSANAPVNRPDNDALSENARLLEGVLADFGVQGHIVEVRPGPVVTLYELDPAPGTKTSRVVGLADDIARSMSAFSVRIAVVAGRSTIGIELPNARRQTVNFRDLLLSDSFQQHHEKSGGGLTIALGLDIGGEPVMVDLARMPHLLIAGTTGSGKSVAVNTMICSLLFRLTPAECRFIMIDPKMLELSAYADIPHLLTPVVTDSSKAVVALKWAVKEMENRYRHMSVMGVRNIAGYNQKLREAAARGHVLSRTVTVGFDPTTDAPLVEEQSLDLTPLPFIVVIVDEMADLMLVAGKDVEAAIQRLAQMARAAGIHLVMATQRPSVDVITGTIKANFPTRVSFQVTSKIDSRTILGEQGAEQLLGQGDMLYMAAGGRTTRVHGPFISDAEVEAVANFLRAGGQPNYLTAVTEEDEGAAPLRGGERDAGGGEGGEGSEGGGDNALFDQAVALVARERKASVSFVQRHLQIGYNRAARIIEQMEKQGMVSQANHVGKREVLLPPSGGEERY